MSFKFIWVYPEYADDTPVDINVRRRDGRKRFVRRLCECGCQNER